MKITKKELIKTAKELNELMGLDPAIPTAKDTEDSVLMEKIGEAAEMLEEDDEISEVAQEVIDYIAEQQEEDDEQQEEDDEEEAEEEQTTEQLIEASDYKGLKAMVADYPEFKGIDINIYPAKKIEELRARMLRDLAKKAEKKAPEAAAAKKDAVKKDAPAKKEKKEPKQSGPGVIATIVACIEGAGKKGVSKEEILAELIKVFPDKDANSMKSTINVQVPARISKERFKVENKDGKYFKA